MAIDKIWLEEFVSDLPWTIMDQVDESLSLVLNL